MEHPGISKIMKPYLYIIAFFCMLAPVLEAQHSPQVQSVTSTDNSSTTPLASAATYTGTWENCEKYESVIVAVKADQNGIFYIDFSPDGTNVDSTLTKYYNTTDIEAPHRYTVTRKFFRIRFTNDSASAQTSLRLQTTLKSGSADLNSPLDQTLARDFDSISVRPSDYKTEVALGLRQGHTLWNKFGYNDDVDTASAEVVGEFGGTFTYLTAASTLTIVSDNAADDDGSTGATGIVIYGIDGDRKSQTEVVTMDGTTNVVTVSTWLGINRISIYSAGSGETNAGTITVTATTGGSTQATMPAGEGTSQQAIFFTQADHQGLFEWMTMNAVKISGGGGSPVVTVRGYVYSAISGAKYEVFRTSLDTGVQNSTHYDPPLPFVIGEQSVFWMEASTDTNNTAVRIRMSLIEVKDKDAD